ncbi:TolC family protein [Chryseolinea lacunae]|uniref:TolC family protein n=1 Tax=Chryseolinea lacunae TaxID=2801331 RepID=A0ABS1KQ07_9BACT|nr:TolC family protein [Chryseolinea lacunae]MBL0741317.1 TolC family protein [Chryseolinea lacunae]
MKPFYRILVLSLVVPLWVNAQTQPDEKSSFTLDESISYALANTVSVKNARIDAQMSEAKVKETFGIGLPQVSGSVALQHNPKLPRFYSKYTEGQPSIIDLSTIPGISNGDVVAFQNVFQLPSNGTAGLTINQLLFSSTYLVGLKAAGTYKDLAYKTEEQTQIQVLENVTKAYYAVLINNERISLFDNNIARVDTLLRNTTALNQNGFAEAIDVDRIQVTLNNLKTERLKFLNSQNLSLGLLKFQMNYPMEKDLTVVGNLTDLTVNENLFNEYEEGWDYKNRIEYKLLDTQRKLQELDIKNKYSNSMPSLSGYLNLGYGTQSPTIGGLFKTESNIPSTSEFGPDKWYPYTAFGITLNVPLFTGLQHTYQIQQSKLSLLKIQNNYNSLKQTIDLSIEQNTTVYKNSLETLKSQRENMALADKVARVTKIKYEQGVGSNIEVTDAENSLKEAQINYYNALYDAIVAKVDLDKAYAKLDPTKYAAQQPAK